MFADLSDARRIRRPTGCAGREFAVGETEKQRGAAEEETGKANHAAVENLEVHAGRAARAKHSENLVYS